jgi:hypothetical protein
MLPNLLLYTAYYWALQTASVNCLRFFLTILPPLVLGAAWLLTRPWPTAKGGCARGKEASPAAGPRRSKPPPRRGSRGPMLEFSR